MPENGVVHFELQERSLDNGLRVVVQEDHTAPVVSVHIMYHVGSKHERRGRTGFAHLFEHLMFQGSEHVPNEAHFKLIQDAGGTLNGSTWFDRLDNQRDVVKNERRQSYENRPYGLAVETVLRMAYPEGHPYHHPTIGYMEDLDAAGLEDVREFFRTFYRPDNAVLVLVGALEAERGYELADKYFGEIRGSPGTPQLTAPAVPPGSEARDTIYDNVQFPRVYIFHHSPAFGKPGFEAADVLSSVLSDGKSSRLYRKLVYEDRIAQDVSAQVWPTEDCGLSFIVATARPGVEAETLESAILETLDDVRRGTITQREAVGGINRATRELVNAFDGVGSRSDAIATSTTFLGRPEYVNELFPRVQAVTTEAMVQVANEWFVPERRATLYILPESSAEGGE